MTRTAILLALIGWPLYAQSEAGVNFEGRTLFTIHTQVGQLSAPDRALLAERRLGEVARDGKTAVEAIVLRERPDVTDIYAGASFLLSITDGDAAAVGRPRQALAAERLAAIRAAITGFREERNWKNLLWASFYAALVTLLFLAAAAALNWLFRRIRNFVFEMRKQGRGALRYDRSELISAKRSAAIVLSAASLARWLLLLLMLEIYIPVALDFFPGTAGYAAQIKQWALEPLRFVWSSFVDFLPNLFFIAVIAVVTYGLIRVSDFLFGEIGAGRIKFEGFYPDWALPTSRLVRALALVLGAIVVFPYLPGSKSPAFQGVSIFLGVLLSLGSTSAVANAVAGTILTYMRPFQIGDRVKINDMVGDVIEKNLLVTRIQTIKNEIITLPNANILNGQMWNFSTSARENNLILHTSVTIGYSTPWRTVHKLLIDAALSVEGIEASPKPFVLQSALNDFYVVYELNAYTADACRMINIYSDLHQSIQDRFNEGGVEIMSPHYTQIRDGNTVTIPADYLPAGYQAPAVRIEQVTRRAAQAI